MKRAPLVAAIVGVVLAGLVALFAFSPKGEREQESKLIGTLAPALAGSTLDGDSFDIDQHRGEWVLVNFFATWCGPCKVEHPELVEFSEQTRGSATVVSVAFNDDADSVERFFEENGGDWPVITEDTGGASIDYGVVKLPESYLVDPEGTVVHKFVGGIQAAEVLDTIDAVTAARR